MITGAPGSGKTTYARENMGDGDILVDLDVIKAALIGNRNRTDIHAQIYAGQSETVTPNSGNIEKCRS